MILTANEWAFYLMCPKDPYFALCYFINFCVVSFCSSIHAASYMDVSNSYSTGSKIFNVLFKPKNAVETLVQWFMENKIKRQPGKYYLLVNNSFQIEIAYSKFEKLIVVKLVHESALKIVYKNHKSSF